MTGGPGGTDFPGGPGGGAADAGPGDSTRSVHAGRPPATAYEPSLPGPVFVSHYHLPGEAAGPYLYGRDDNPTWERLEQAISELEAPGDPEVGTAVFASGMAAVAAVLLSQVKAGQTVLLPSDSYQTTRALRERLESYGVSVRLAPTAGDAQLAAVEGASLVWLETPSNPGLDVCDIRRLADAAHAAGALVAVDNTLATPLGQRPLSLGADFSVASGTKALSGHGDLLLGYVSTRDPELAASVRYWRKTVGAIPGPMEAWLAHRSIATFALRVERQSANALALATALLKRPEVSDLRHPGLPTDASHEVASRQMRRFGSVVSFTLPDQAHAERFLAALRMTSEATSFGSIQSTAERRARWGGDAVPPGFVRFSVGIEDPQDIVADVLRALDAAAGA
ncbi:cystathionine gamma-lyase [Actinacidiphila bryophytorum]|uniref:Cystathionine gamma-lyase n=1 Tax=Actinacidiphila bryophytorum TaxID=1436133 RepID=A0A9W4H554_9ACTN|nr:cystathionine gamma-lyase [Actinacidiphila bryophytorum]MBM9437281.1 cystathionine gamma-lyase [Actinacidiphila bryophytorum]MBN6541953.1 cystathionine gamma-lyase [Actinacidiphila bryophytorum]CAG7651424.1 Putative cystathionine gamma-lyase [Actinacidiphila bryophytorum]